MHMVMMVMMGWWWSWRYVEVVLEVDMTWWRVCLLVGLEVL